MRVAKGICRASRIGDRIGPVRSFENAMVFHFPHARERGTVITLDPGVAHDRNSPLAECLDRIQT